MSDVNPAWVQMLQARSRSLHRRAQLARDAGLTTAAARYAEDAAEVDAALNGPRDLIEHAAQTEADVS